MIQFLYHNLRFRPPIVPSLLLIVLQSEAVVRWCSAKKIFANIASFTRKHQNKRLAFHEVANLQSLTLSKRDSGTDVFFGKFCEISHNIFLKNPSDGCFCINTRSVYFPTTNFRFSENDVTNKKRGNKSELNISNPQPERSLFSTQSSICDRAFLRKQLTPVTKKVHRRCSTRF